MELVSSVWRGLGGRNEREDSAVRRFDTTELNRPVSARRVAKFNARRLKCKKSAEGKGLVPDSVGKKQRRFSLRSVEVKSLVA